MLYYHVKEINGHSATDEGHEFLSGICKDGIFKPNSTSLNYVKHCQLLVFRYWVHG